MKRIFDLFCDKDWLGGVETILCADNTLVYKSWKIEVDLLEEKSEDSGDKESYLIFKFDNQVYRYDYTGTTWYKAKLTKGVQDGMVDVLSSKE